MRWNWLDEQNRNVKDTQRIKDFLNDQIPKGTIKNITLDSLSRDGKYLFAAGMTIEKFALPKDNSFVVKPWVFGMLDNITKTDTTRNWQTILRRNLVYEIEYHVRAGQGSYSRQDGDSWKYDFPGLQSHFTNNSHGDSLITSFELYLPPMTLSPEQYISYNRDRKQFQRSAQSGITFKP